MKPFNLKVIVTVMSLQLCSGYDWEKLRCSMDREPVTPGLQPPEQIGRFPWMGLIQHDFYSADKMRYSITGAVLIHPEYALAAAEDMAKIDKDILRNSTYFVLWYSAEVKYTMGVDNYKLHKEYETVTYATIALVKIVRDSNIELGNPGPIMQICMPIKGTGTFGNIYAVKVTDENGEFQKEVVTMDIVEIKNCDLYDNKAEIPPEEGSCNPAFVYGIEPSIFTRPTVKIEIRKFRTPVSVTLIGVNQKNARNFQTSVFENSLVDVAIKVPPTHDFSCAAGVKDAGANVPDLRIPTGVQATCFIDSGAVLISRESEVYWTLLGFGVRGPTCTAPARFIFLMSQMEWIESQIPA